MTLDDDLRIDDVEVHHNVDDGDPCSAILFVTSGIMTFWTVIHRSTPIPASDIAAWQRNPPRGLNWALHGDPTRDFLANVQRNVAAARKQ